MRKLLILGQGYLEKEGEDQEVAPCSKSRALIGLWPAACPRGDPPALLLQDQVAPKLTCSAFISARYNQHQYHLEISGRVAGECIDDQHDVPLLFQCPFSIIITVKFDRLHSLSPEAAFTVVDLEHALLEGPILLQYPLVLLLKVPT